MKKEATRNFSKIFSNTEHEPSFPDIRKAFQKFDQILKDYEKMKNVFPYGAKHFQVSEKRGTKYIKEISPPPNSKLK